MESTKGILAVIGSEGYVAAYPKTVAEQVIESDEKQFISKAEKDILKGIGDIGAVLDRINRAVI